MENVNASSEFHNKCLDKLRFCARILTGYAWEVKDHTENIFKALELNVKTDESLVHPSKFCNLCYCGIGNFLTRGKKPSVDIYFWGPRVTDCLTCAIYKKKSTGGRPIKKKAPGGRRTETVAEKMTVVDVMKLSACKPLPDNVEKMISHVMGIKMQQSALPNKSVELKTRGPQPVTLVPIGVPRKESTVASIRTLQARSKQSKGMIKMISGNTEESFLKQTSLIVKSFDQVSREKLMSDINIHISEEHTAAMKANLGITWHLMRQIRLWLGTFNIKMASEAKTRDLSKEWIGEGIRSEHAPLFVKGKVESRAWCYIYNLVGHVMKRLSDHDDGNLLVQHPFISHNEIVIKIGGDHGGKSFKMCYQIANVDNPNRCSNTVLFSIFDGKDNLPNLRMCLDRFKAHVDKLLNLTWSQKVFRVFMYGDYAFLSYMYGLSGANAVYPCLWCLCSKDEMQVSKFLRETSEKRTLENLNEHYIQFCKKGMKKGLAKTVYNVIDIPFFNIPIDQVCIPGLHLTLGIFLKMFNMFEAFCFDVDMKIGVDVEQRKEIKSLQDELDDLCERRDFLQGELNWFLVSDDRNVDKDAYIMKLKDVGSNIEEKEKQISTLSNEMTETTVGPCVSSLDGILKAMGVERQAYHSNSYIGNDCHLLLKSENITKLCCSILDIVRELEKGELLIEVGKSCEQFENLNMVVVTLFLILQGI